MEVLNLSLSSPNLLALCTCGAVCSDFVYSYIVYVCARPREKAFKPSHLAPLFYWFCVGKTRPIAPTNHLHTTLRSLQNNKFSGSAEVLGNLPEITELCVGAVLEHDTRQSIFLDHLRTAVLHSKNQGVCV